eukprot:scaffold473_cov156-Amphora_coffeaeformis.AAC.16
MAFQRLSISSFTLLLAISNSDLSNAFNAVHISVSSRPKYVETHLNSSSNPADGRREAIAQKEVLSTTLNELDGLKSNILEAPDKETLEMLQQSLTHIEFKVATQVSTLLPPVGLSASDFASALKMYAKLPIRSRIAFCQALDIENPRDAALDFDRIPEIVTLLYTERLTTTAIENSIKTTANLVIKERSDFSTELPKLSKDAKGKSNLNNDRSALFGETSQEEAQLINLVEQTFTRTTRQEGRVATEQDLQTLVKALDRETFVVTGKEAIPGGFLIRGTPNSKLADKPDALLQAIDDRLPAQWSCQVSCVEDFTASMRGETDGLNRPALLLFKKDMSPESRPVLRTLSNLSALTTAFLFSVGVYGGNKLAMARLEEKSPSGDFIGFEWFTDKTLEVLLPILLIQAVHEFGHWAIAQRDGLKVATPTLLPSWGLPVLGCQSNIEESPKNRTSLFDFAVVGPSLGLLASVGFLVAGLELTNAADPETLKFLPSLPVDVLRSSTLGGSLVDYFLGGGQGFVTLQDPKEAVPLHPFAIAGFTGLLANALALLPLGSTDGGRMSITVFTRPGQFVISTAVWLFLLVASFSFERADALIGAWVVYNIVQNDLEIPCRDEISQVDPYRVVTAFGLWVYSRWFGDETCTGGQPARCIPIHPLDCHESTKSSLVDKTS